MKKLFITFVLAALATPSFAWGPREQGILTGVAGLWIFQQLDKAGRPQPPVVVQQPPVVVQQPPVIIQQPQPQQPQTQLPPPVGQVYQQQFCETKPVQDQFGTWRYVSFCYTY
jgi:hypothetical protein